MQDSAGFGPGLNYIQSNLFKLLFKTIFKKSQDLSRLRLYGYALGFFNIFTDLITGFSLILKRTDKDRGLGERLRRKNQVRGGVIHLYPHNVWSLASENRQRNQAKRPCDKAESLYDLYPPFPKMRPRALGDPVPTRPQKVYLTSNHSSTLSGP